MTGLITSCCLTPAFSPAPLVPTEESCLELYQLSRPLNLGFTHPSRVLVYPVAHNTIDCSLATKTAVIYVYVHLHMPAAAVSKCDNVMAPA